jgi:hypothetical protein
LELEEIIVQITNLQEQIRLIDSNLKFNITVFLAMLAFFLGLAGWALYLFAKSIVEKGLDNRINLLRKELKERYDKRTEELKSGSIVESGSNNSGCYYIWGNKRREITSKIYLRMESSSKLSGYIVFPAAFAEIHHINLSLMNVKGSTIADYTIIPKNVTTTGLSVEVMGGVSTEFNEKDELFVTAHVVGR